MDEILYPAGYGKTLMTLADLKVWAKFNQMDPVYALCLEPWLVSRGGHIGIGGAFRITQPTKPGFAPDGRSFHQLQQFADGGFAFMAVDLVCRNGDMTHRSPRWDEVPRQGSGHPDIRQYKLHCNVDGEPWHIQHISVDGWSGWVNRGRLRPTALPNVEDTKPLPQPPPQPTPTPPPSPDPVPVPIPLGSYTVPTLTSLRLGAMNNPAHVQVWQSQLNRWFQHWGFGLTYENGVFDEHTKNCTVLFQTCIRDREGRTSSVDGVVGPQSWGNIFSDC